MTIRRSIGLVATTGVLLTVVGAHRLRARSPPGSGKCRRQSFADCVVGDRTRKVGYPVPSIHSKSGRLDGTWSINGTFPS